MTGAPATGATASFRLRPFADADAPGAAELLRGLWSHYLVTPELLVHWRRHAPARADVRWWVAEVDNELVGYGEGQRRWRVADPNVGDVWVGVRADARGRGIGSALHDVVLEHVSTLGLRTLRSFVDGDEGLSFARRRGYEETRREQVWTLDPRTADLSELPELERAKAAERYRVVPLRELLDRPHDLHALFVEAESDIPADDEPGELAFEDWEKETLRNPLLDPDASAMVVLGDRPVSFAWLTVDREGGRAEHELTGTARDHRGRGLARLAKLAALRWCADNGVHTVLTSNDSENAPMLRINERLGYRPTIVSVEVAKTLA